MVLSMLAAPLIIQHSERLVRKLTANDWLARAAQITAIAATSMARQDHVIVCGYGRSGQNLVRLLETEDISLVALDNDPQRVREAAGSGNVVYGDASRRETLIAAGLPKARAVVITFADTPQALKILHAVQRERPNLPVIVRTVDDSELDRLTGAGATEVVPEVLEGSLMLAMHSLLVLGMPLPRVLARIRAIREERYSLFRGFFHGITDIIGGAESGQPRLHSVVLPEGATAIGATLGSMMLGDEVQIAGIRRHGATSVHPGEDWTFEPGDIVVLLGESQALGRAEERLLR
jgi:CPA2 family monovalent cation:H+ antiporter-2